MGALDAALGGRRGLIVVAVDAEAGAVRRGAGVDAREGGAAWARVGLGTRFDLVVSGVGKANAAGATARALDPERHALVISAGVAGLLPGAHCEEVDLGAVIAATRSVFGDEGMRTGASFETLAAMGFAPIPGSGDGMGVDADPGLLAALRGAVDGVGVIATVSTCSASDAGAREIAQRTGAHAEAMEGAAVATVARTLGVAFAEVRAISNTAGDRERQRWDIASALDALARCVSVW